MSSLARTHATQKRKEGLIGLALVAPLLIYLAIFLIAPLATMLSQSVYDPSVRRDLPMTVAALGGWNAGDELPDEAFAALLSESRALFSDRRTGDAAMRLDFESPGIGGLFSLTARAVAEGADEGGNPKSTLLGIDERWATAEPWAAIKRSGDPLTASFFIRAFDHKFDASGRIVPVKAGEYPHTSLLIKTLWIGALITAVSLLLAYPLAYFISRLSDGLARVVLYFVVMSLWLSLLVRASSWIVLLQANGVLNDALVTLGVIDAENRTSFVYNLTGMIVAMVHFMLPMMVLPILAIMRRIPKSLMRAAESLGAHPWVGFLKVYLPATLPGVAVAVLFGFIQAIGFFIIPALLGGSDGQLISTLIATYTNYTMSYGLASALGAVLLVVVLGFYVFYAWLTRADTVSLGNGSDVVVREGKGAAPATTLFGRIAESALAFTSVATLVFLIAPMIVIIPLSFSDGSFLTFSPEMLVGEGWSIRWYEAVFADERWTRAFLNSFIIALCATGIVTVLGGMAALGLARPTTPGREVLSALFLSPTIVPIVLIGTGTFLMYSTLGLVGTVVGVVAVHAALIAPAVVFNVRAALAGWGVDLQRASASLGAKPIVTFLRVTLPLTAPGFAAGALFAFLGSFDETVIVQFLIYSPEQFTFPRQMFSGVRDDMNPSVLAAGTLVIALFTTLYALSQFMLSLRKRLSS